MNVLGPCIFADLLDKAGVTLKIIEPICGIDLFIRFPCALLIYINST